MTPIKALVSDCFDKNAKQKRKKKEEERKAYIQTIYITLSFSVKL